jgi:phosphoribosylformimino-5-aminoimidazole carboxamide ribotide isomerase
MVRLVEEGVRGFVYTDISRDGLLSGPNFDRTEEVKHSVQVPVIASGGVTSLTDLQQLRERGIDGAIVGRALYTGDMDLSEALSVLQGRNSKCS